MIDDHRLLRKGLADLINAFDGFEVILEADHGNAFIENHQKIPIPDIILLDINMPVLDGFDTMAWIRQHLPESKVLVLSMVDSELAMIKLLKAGAKGFIRKDSSPETFRKALESLGTDGYYLGSLSANPSNSNIHQTPVAAVNTRNASHLFNSKELQFLTYACSEMTYRAIALEMGISPRAADGYRDALFTKLKVGSRVGLVLYAIKNGIVVM